MSLRRINGPPSSITLAAACECELSYPHSVTSDWFVGLRVLPSARSSREWTDKSRRLDSHSAREPF